MIPHLDLGSALRLSLLTTPPRPPGSGDDDNDDADEAARKHVETGQGRPPQPKPKEPS